MECQGAAQTEMSISSPVSTSSSPAEGNIDFTTQLIDSGHLGYWCTSAFEATPVTIDVNQWYQAIHYTLAGFLGNHEQPFTSMNNRANEVARILALGWCTITYMKLRGLVITDLPGHHKQALLKRPLISDILEIPSGFAFAIQQLGRVNVVDDSNETSCVPCFPDTGHICGIPTEHVSRGTLMPMDKLLNMQEALIYEDGVFDLECPIPEVNFSKEMALTYTMFLKGEDVDPSRAFVDISPLGTDSFGTMLCNPHHGINLSTFEAVLEINSNV